VRRTESLQVAHEDIRRLPEIKLLAGSSVFLTPRAIPHVLLREDFGPLELVEAIIQRDAGAAPGDSGLTLHLEGNILKLLGVRVRFGAAVIAVVPGVETKDHVPSLLTPIDNKALAKMDKSAVINKRRNLRLGRDIRHLETIGQMLVASPNLGQTPLLLGIRLLLLARPSSAAANLVLALRTTIHTIGILHATLEKKKKKDRYVDGWELVKTYPE
jgi:hypothetical protein